ncbi:ABC transporter permease subunit [Acidaminobacter sp. JC074]|uniref:ABC transporter permease n=1 Tax=Acidaminobacter sp. JC074 TaxID=2530199 RepID=UPI001F0DD744|nr:ABC transporter permease subunit [Acidaminobacter sp. JC074]MCH4888441.1 ABC transporter permease subunit [Acidaminobacter sp. JC074]
MVKKHKVLFVFMIIVLWEVLAYSGKLPSSIEILKTFLTDLPAIGLAVYNSILVIFKAIIISLMVSGLMIFMGRHEKVDDCIQMLVTVCHPIPGVALLPLIFMWIGPGPDAILIIVTHAVLWPLYINIKSSYKQIHSDYAFLLKVFRVGRLKKVTKVYVPGMMPGILSGLKIGWSRGWRGFISAEMIFSVIGESTGIGWYIFMYRIFGNMAGVFAGIVAVILISLIVEKVVFEQVEKRTIERWI